MQLFEQVYKPPTNKKELNGFLDKNNLDEYKVCPFCESRIELLVLRRPKIMVMLHSWLDRIEPYLREDFSLQFIYKCHANLVFPYLNGETPDTPIDYGCGESVGYRRLEFSGIHPLKEIVKGKSTN